MTAVHRVAAAGPAKAAARRFCLRCAGAALAGAWPGLLRAGSQVEEPLIDSVRSALRAAIAGQAAPPQLRFASTGARMTYLRWLMATSERLYKRMPDVDIRREFLQTLWYETRRAGLEISLVLGLIQVESAFRKFAISSAGARGYMQIMPFWMRLIGDGDVSKLFHMQTNLRFGCVILRHYLDREKGDLYMALGRYNGSRGKPQYPNAVFAAQKHWVVEGLEQPEEAPGDAATGEEVASLLASPPEMDAAPHAANHR